MPITGSQKVTTSVFVKTNYLFSLLVSITSILPAIVGALVVFAENVRKLGKYFTGQYNEHEGIQQ
jgi:hypothetical protein